MKCQCGMIEFVDVEESFSTMLSTIKLPDGSVHLTAAGGGHCTPSRLFVQQRMVEVVDQGNALMQAMAQREKERDDRQAQETIDYNARAEATAKAQAEQAARAERYAKATERIADALDYFKRENEKNQRPLV